MKEECSNKRVKQDGEEVEQSKRKLQVVMEGWGGGVGWGG